MTARDMDCREVRALGDAYLDDELLVETNHAVLAHLGTCAACRAEIERRRTFRAMLKRTFEDDAQLAPRPTFASDLKNQLRPSAKAAAHGWRRHMPWVVAAIAAAFMITWMNRAGAPQMADDPTVQRLAESAAGDHRDCALRHQPSEPPVPLDSAASYDAAWPGLDQAVRSSATRLASPATTVGAHACVWKGRRFGHVVLSYKSAVVSVLVTRPDGDITRYATAAVTRCPTASEFAVACFASPRHVVFVVSDLPPGEAVEVARDMAPGVREHLSRVLVAAADTTQSKRDAP